MTATVKERHEEAALLLSAAGRALLTDPPERRAGSTQVTQTLKAGKQVSVPNAGLAK